MIIDALLVLLLAGGFLLGFLRGLVRQLLAIGAWLITFVGTAHLRAPLGEWLDESSSEFARDYSLLLAFVVLYLAIFTAALLLVEFSGAGSSLTRHPVLDDALGGVVGLIVAILLICGAVVVLDSYYVATPVAQAGEVAWLRDIQRSLSGSPLVDLLHQFVVRPLGLLLGPLLPSDVRAVMG